ncbi:type IV pilin protein [Glaciimonas sp. GG7]
MNKLTSKQQSGFTMIELVMVIVIMGILAAVALPKFVDLKGSGQTAALAGVQGSINSASTINYGEYYAGNGKGTNLIGMTCSAAASALLQDGVLPTGYTVSSVGPAAATAAAAAAATANANAGTTGAAATAATNAATAATAALGAAGTTTTASGVATTTAGTGTAGALAVANTAVTNAINNTTGVTAATMSVLRATAAAALTANNAAVAAAALSASDSMGSGDNICTLTGPSGATLPVHISA